MDPVEQDLIDGLAADRALDRYLVYADHLQTRGDPRGELIALAVHARQTGQHDRRSESLQTEVERDLIRPWSDTGGGVVPSWELGFVTGLVLESRQLGRLGALFERPELALLESISIVDTGDGHAWPVEQIAAAPFARTIARIAVGGTRAPVSLSALDELIARLPKLIGLEICGDGSADPVLDRLESFARLEELALWMKSSDGLQERIFTGPWNALRALTTTGMASQQAMPRFLEPVLDGTRFPALAELAIHASGGIRFEGAVIERLAATTDERALRRRLRRLGFDWSNTLDTVLEAARDALTDVELVWPMPLGERLSARQHYSFARRLRIGMARAAQALPHAQAACELAPRDYSHWTELGYTLGKLDRLPEQIAAMERAIAIEPGRASAHTARADALRDLSRSDEAEAGYAAVLAREPERTLAHNGLGLVQARRGDSAGALRSFDRALELEREPTYRATFAANAIEIEIEEGRLAAAVERHARARAESPTDRRLEQIGAYLRILGGAAAEVPASSDVTGAPNDEVDGMLACRAAAHRDLANRVAADAAYERISSADCPAYIAFAWLGQAIVGLRDPFAAFSERDPAALADAIAARVNAARGGVGKVVHTTETRCDDRIHVGACAVIAAIAAGRAADARQLADGLAAFLDGPAPVKHNHWWLELAELVHHVAGHATSRELAELARRTYRVATGRDPPRVLAAAISEDVRPDY